MYLSLPETQKIKNVNPMMRIEFMGTQNEI